MESSQLISKLDETDQENSDMLTISVSENYSDDSDNKIPENDLLDDIETSEDENQNSGNEKIKVKGVNFAVDYIYRGPHFENYNAYTYSATVYKQVRNKSRGTKNGYEF